MFTRFVMVSILLFSVFAQSEQIKFNDKVGHSVAVQMAAAAKVDVIVLMQEQADLSAADMIVDRSEKVRFVYNTLKQTAELSQASLVQNLKRKSISHKRFLSLNAIAIEKVDLALLLELATRSDVRKIIADPLFRMPELPGVLDRLLMPELAQLAPGENIVSTGAPNVWNISQGEGIVVAGQDTGIQWDHPALKNQYRGWDGTQADHTYSWHDAIKTDISGSPNPCGRNISVPCDDHGHGTHTIGTVVGDDGAANKIGMAPRAKWIGCRNMDNGVGRPSTYIECFDFFLAPFPQTGNVFSDGRPDLAAHVVNNSWGCPASELCEGEEFVPVLENLFRAGVFIVASAGNEGPGCSTISDAPAHHSQLTFSVGAHNHKTGAIAGFSSRGPSGFDGAIGPDVTAPGVSIRSSTPGNGYQGAMWSGTSMAGPHVVGQVALMWGANRNLIGNIARTSEIIRLTATPKTSTETCGGISGQLIPNNTFGYGLINAERAVRQAVLGL
jgi:serine protease AprX